MTEELISEIGLDPAGSLYVQPRARAFPAIYRAAMEVEWNPVDMRLFSPRPREWSYLRWFQQILAAAVSEYGVHLVLSAETQWRDISVGLRAEIEAFDAQRAVERRGDIASLETARERREGEEWFRDLMLRQELDAAQRLWADERYEEYARLLAPHRDELSPAQLKRLSIAKRRAGLL